MRMPLNPVLPLQPSSARALPQPPLPFSFFRVMFDLVHPIQQHLSSDILIDNHDNKISSGNLYLRQPHTVIQLIEVSSPPPRRIASVINSSSAASSSYSSSSSSSSFDEEDQEQDEESVCSSYCSSDLSPEELDAPSSVTTASSSDSFSLRMKRILLWREHSPHLTSDSSSLKRKLEEIDEVVVDNDDNVSRTSKRSRSHGSTRSSSSDRSMISLEFGMHSCPACDAFFPTRQELRQHGRDAQTNEACCVAVEYAFEE
ncbi:hypothetical protein B0H34DRAFT_797114 [Crassisporium funariophilum]|nr:hypothetical protein B0H34DRAFT_797114 [Crassisporium funariophilum]